MKIKRNLTLIKTNSSFKNSKSENDNKNNLKSFVTLLTGVTYQVRLPAETLDQEVSEIRVKGGARLKKCTLVRYDRIRNVAYFREIPQTTWSR